MRGLINKEDSIFIAGHKGMVGSAIMRCLKKNGYNNLLFTTKKDLDLSNFESVGNWFENNRPKIVILAAAKVGGIYANSRYPADFILENLKIQNNVIENAWKYKVKKFLFLGSSCIYPKHAPQPLKEEYLLTGPLEITNESYALAKIAGIKLCNALNMQYGFDAISLMPPNIYGPGDNYHESNSHVMPSLIYKFYNAKLKNLPEVFCWGSGSPRREFLYVDDLAEACIFSLENISGKDKILRNEDSEYLGILNVGMGEEVSINELAKLISSTMGYEGRIVWDCSKPNGTPRKLLNIERLKKLGWKSKVSIREGIKLTAEHFSKEYENKTLRR